MVKENPHSDGQQDVPKHEQAQERLRALETSPASPACKEGARRLRAILDNPRHPLITLPSGGSLALQKEQQKLSDDLAFLSESVDRFVKNDSTAERQRLTEDIVLSFLRRVEAFERDATEASVKTFDSLMKDPALAPYRAQLREVIGVHEGTQEAFEGEMRSMAKPLSAPTQAQLDGRSEREKEYLTTQYQELRQLQYLLVEGFFNDGILLLKDKAEYPEEFKDAEGNELPALEKEAAVRAIATFLLRRDMYEAKIHRQPTPRAPAWLAMTGMVAEEVAEEGLETIRFGKGAFLEKMTPPWLREWDAATRAKILEGMRGASGMVGSKCPALRDIVKQMDRSPFGRRFWKDLFTIESPVTVVLYMIYVNSSTNKLKSTLDFAAYLGASALTTATMELFEKMAMRPLILRAVASARAAGNMRVARGLMYLLRAPKNPAIQLTVALAVAFGLSSVIDQLTTMIDDAIPDGAGKRALNDGIDLLSGSSTIDAVVYGVKEFGAFHDPERDAFDYLSTELLTLDPRTAVRTFVPLGSVFVEEGKDPGLKRRYQNGIAEWNAIVDRRIEGEWNPLSKRLYELERANTGEWADRQALHVFSQVEYLRTLQTELRASLKGRSVPSGVDFVFLATNDASDERPDHAILRTEDDSATPEYAAATYVAGIKSSAKSEDKELVSLWSTYRAAALKLGKEVSVFQHLGVYDRASWVGGGSNGGKASLPPAVMRGVAAEVAYLAKRRDVVTYREDGALARDEFSRSLASHARGGEVKADVSGVPFAAIFTDGTLVRPESVFYKKNLLACAEAAALYLPKDHDINLLLARLRDAVVNKTQMSAAEVRAIRDDLLTAVLAHQETLVPPAADPALASELKLTGKSVYVSGKLGPNVNDRLSFPTFNPRTRTHDVSAYAHVFSADAARSGDADIFYFQGMEPLEGAHHPSGIMAMTTVRCLGPDPSSWQVRVYKRAITPNDFIDKDVGRQRRLVEPSTVSDVEEMDFSVWKDVHPAAFAAMRSTVDALAADRAKAFDAVKAEREEALKRVGPGNAEYVWIPGENEFRRGTVDGGAIVLRDVPQARSYADEDSGVGGLDYKRELNIDTSYRFEYVGPHGERKSYTVESAEFWEDPAHARDRLRLIDAVTTPIPGKDAESIEGVLNLFRARVTHVSPIGYAVGYRNVAHYDEMLSALLPSYRAARDKKKFLSALFWLAKGRGSVVDENSGQIVRLLSRMRGTFEEVSAQRETPEKQLESYVSEATKLHWRIKNAPFLNQVTRSLYVELLTLVMAHPEMDPERAFLPELASVPEDGWSVHASAEVKEFVASMERSIPEHLKAVVGRSDEFVGSAFDLPPAAAPQPRDRWYVGHERLIPVMTREWNPYAHNGISESPFAPSKSLNLFSEGTRTTYEFSKAAPGREEWETPMGTLSCTCSKGRQGGLVYSWGFEASKKGAVYASHTNEYGHEDFGMWLSVDQEPPLTRDESVPGQRFVILPANEPLRYDVTLRLSDGRTVSASDVLGVGIDKLPAEFKKFVNVEYLTYASNRIMFRESKDSARTYWGWRASVSGCKLTPLSADGVTVASVEYLKRPLSFGQYAPSERGRARLSRDAFPVERVGKDVSRLPDALPSDLSGTLLPTQGKILYPHGSGAMELTLWDGRVIKGNVGYPPTFAEYVEIRQNEPRRYTDVPETAPKPSERGVTLAVLNRTAVRSVKLEYPDGRVATVDVRSPARRIADLLKLRQARIGMHFVSDALEGEFYVRSDGTVLWTGDKTRGQRMLSLRDGKLESLPWTDAEAGFPLTVKPGARSFAIEYRDGSIVTVQADAGTPSAADVAFERSADGGWTIDAGESVEAVRILPAGSSAFQYVSFDHPGYPRSLNIE